MTFNDGELAALQSGVFRLGIFFRLDTGPPVRLWLGFGNIDAGVNVYDEAGALYRGMGELREIPVINQLLNGAAERVEFTLSGVSGEVLAAAANDSAEVKGKRAALGFALLDAGWALIGPVHWCASYTADFIGRDQATVQPGADIVRTITLSCGSRFTGRRRPTFSYFSDADQRARHPGDLFCSKVGQYAHGFDKQWPTFP